jgi:hypothetical protein
MRHDKNQLCIVRKTRTFPEIDSFVLAHSKEFGGFLFVQKIENTLTKVITDNTA